MRFRDWLIVAAHSEDVKGLDMESLERPSKVGGHDVPVDLSEMTLGQMLDLQECSNGEDMFYLTCRVLLGMERGEVDNARAVEVVCFCGWVAGRVKWINGLFESVKVKPTDVQVRAGIGKMNFGVFGMIDWYAKRMGITDHNQVFGVSWMRIYKCLQIDAETEKFNREVQKVIQADNNRKRGS